MNKNNFVTPLAEATKNNYTVAVPEIVPVNPSQAFDGRDLRQPNVDPFRRGLEFNIKYAPLTVITLVLAVGLGMRNNWSFGTSAVVFAAISIAGYWLLGFTENVFDPYSGHVIKAFFGWLVLRHQISANERMTLAYYQVEQKRLEVDSMEKRLQLDQRAATERKLLLPQNDLNQLATYQHPPISREAMAAVSQISAEELAPPTWGKAPAQTNDGSKALQTLLDFVEDVYEQTQYTEDGRLTATTPWSKRGAWRDGTSVPQPIKRQVEDMLAQITPSLFAYNPDSKAWTINIEDYPDVTDAYNAIDEVVIRKA